jgi:hypothetical protein
MHRFKPALSCVPLCHAVCDAGHTAGGRLAEVVRAGSDVARCIVCWALGRVVLVATPVSAVGVAGWLPVVGHRARFPVRSGLPVVSVNDLAATMPSVCRLAFVR